MAEDDRENTEEILGDFLETELGYKDAKSVEIQSPSLGEEERRKAQTNHSAFSQVQGLRRDTCTGFSAARYQLQNVSRSSLRDSRKKEKANGHL